MRSSRRFFACIASQRSCTLMRRLASSSTGFSNIGLRTGATSCAPRVALATLERSRCTARPPRKSGSEPVGQAAGTEQSKPPQPASQRHAPEGRHTPFSVQSVSDLHAGGGASQARIASQTQIIVGSGVHKLPPVPNHTFCTFRIRNKTAPRAVQAVAVFQIEFVVPEAPHTCPRCA
jgi:hypothetical protein